MPTIVFDSIKCIKETDDGSGSSDEVYLRIDIDGVEEKVRIPAKGEWSMDAKDTETINEGVYFNTECYVMVKEHDAGKDDDIGTQRFGANPSDWPASPLTMSGEHSEYELAFHED